MGRTLKHLDSPKTPVATDPTISSGFEYTRSYYFRLVGAASLAFISLGLMVWRLAQRPGGETDTSAASISASPLGVPVLPSDLYPQQRPVLEEAQAAVRRLLEEFPQDPNSAAAAALLNDLVHDEIAEVSCWEHCLQLDEDYLLAYSHLATRAVDAGDFVQAETLLRKALTVERASGDFRDLLASALSGQGKLTEAASVLEQSAAQKPGSAETRVLLGEAYLRLDQLEQASAAFEKAIQLDPQMARAYHGLAQIAAKAGRAKEARRHRDEFARLKAAEDRAARSGPDQRADAFIVPKCVAAILSISGKTFLNHQQPEPAIDLLRRAATLDPHGTDSRTALTQAYTQVGQLESALAVVEELRAIEPKNLLHLRALAMLQARLDRLDAAEKTFGELCAAAPNWAVGYAGLAEVRLRTGNDLARARQLAAKAAELEPGGWNYFILAAICEKTGDLAGAELALQRAIELEPNDPRYRQMHASLQRKN